MYKQVDEKGRVRYSDQHYLKTSNEMNILRTSEKKYPILISTPTLHYKSWKNLNFPKLITTAQLITNNNEEFSIYITY